MTIKEAQETSNTSLSSFFQTSVDQASGSMKRIRSTNQFLKPKENSTSSSYLASQELSSNCSSVESSPTLQRYLPAGTIWKVYFSRSSIWRSSAYTRCREACKAKNHITTPSGWRKLTNVFKITGKKTIKLSRFTFSVIKLSNLNGATSRLLFQCLLAMWFPFQIVVNSCKIVSRSLRGIILHKLNKMK